MQRIYSFIKLLLESLYATIRSLLGPNDVCIYPVTCSDYARIMLHTKPWYKSIPLITVRLLSCNPIVGIIRRIRSR